MSLTIAQLAQAVGKNQAYIRQHIHRGHLTVIRDASPVSVTEEEAARWAENWGLPFAFPSLPAIAAGAPKSRAARMSVLSWRQKSGPQVNMFTHIRHRRVEALGPWADIPDETWSSESICLNEEEQSEELWLHTIDAHFERCHEMVKHILETGVLELDGRDIRYELDYSPRRHWAYRNEYTDSDPSVPSPFSMHSAEVHEYWSFNEILRERWIKLLESPPSKLESLLARLRFPLDRRSDRIGNLIISGAEDAIDCDLSATHDGKLVFKVVEGEPALGEYTATIWAAHGEDAVLRRQFEVTREEIAVDLQSDVDHIGFALYRNADGQCIDLMDVYLIMEISFAMHIDSGPTFHLHDLKSGEVDQFNPGGARHTFGVELDEMSAARDRKVRRAVLDRKIHDREHRALQDGNLKRFVADQFSEAVDHFLNLLRQHSYQPEPIYLADPFFMDVDSTGPERKLVLGMIEATAGRPLRILCAPLRNYLKTLSWYHRRYHMSAHASCSIAR